MDYRCQKKRGTDCVVEDEEIGSGVAFRSRAEYDLRNGVDAGIFTQG